MGTAANYDAYWLNTPQLDREWKKPFFDESLGVLVGSKCVLDYGCGMGYSYQRWLVQNVENYIGADISNVALQDAASKGLRAVRIQEDSTTGLDEALCDGAVCSEVFEHLWDPLAAAQELHRVLKPEGTLVATVPNFGYFPCRIRAFIGASVPSEPQLSSNKYKGVHIRFFSKKTLAAMLRDAGFRDVKVYGWCGGNIWDICRCMGPFSKAMTGLTSHMPKFTQMAFLARWFPNVFAERLRVVARK